MKMIPGEHDLRVAVHSLHETGVFRDDEGDATDQLEKMLTWIENYNRTAEGDRDSARFQAALIESGLAERYTTHEQELIYKGWLWHVSVAENRASPPASASMEDGRFTKAGEFKPVKL